MLNNNLLFSFDLYHNFNINFLIFAKLVIFVTNSIIILFIGWLILSPVLNSLLRKIIISNYSEDLEFEYEYDPLEFIKDDMYQLLIGIKRKKISLKDFLCHYTTLNINENYLKCFKNKQDNDIFNDLSEELRMGCGGLFDTLEYSSNPKEQILEHGVSKTYILKLVDAILDIYKNDVDWNEED